MIRSGLFVCFSLPLLSLAVELEAQSFFFCFQRTATGLQSRTVRVHQFPSEDKCAVFYSIKGQDRVLSLGRWLVFCNNKARQVVDNLEKGLWKCREQKGAPVFYSYKTE